MNHLFISGKQLRLLFDLKDSKQEFILFNLDLSKTDKNYRVYLKKDGIFFNQVGLLVSWDLVKKYSKKEELLYLIDRDGLVPLLFYKDKVYRVLSTIPPSLELNGIRMHKSNVYEDVRSKIDVLNIKNGSLVLDTCMGFGYTAIEAAKLGAKVITVEKDSFVVELAKLNPYSKQLFTSRNITMIVSDIYFLDFKDEIFDFIIHDPPRLGSQSGLLYSNEIYSKFYRILKPSGVLFHYIGKPGKRYRNRDILHRVTQRLGEIGFSTKVANNREAIIAKKNRYWI
jgi:predicted methyltransferase